MLIDHIGIVVSDLNQAIDTYSQALKMPVSHNEFLAEANLDIAFFDLGQSSVELLCPRDLNSEGATAKFLRQHGPGIHHLAFKVSNIAQELEHYKNLGHILIDATPRKSVRNTLIAFIHPKTFDGTLIELVQHL